MENEIVEYKNLFNKLKRIKRKKKIKYMKFEIILAFMWR